MGVLLFVIALLQASEEPPSLLAIPDCPRTFNARDGSPQCIQLSIYSGAGERAGRTRFTELSVGEVLAPFPYFAQVVPIRGRLNGGEAQVYRVTLYLGDSPCATDGSVALTGLTQDGRPIILTDLGPFEIIEAEVQTGITSSTLIDPASRTVIRHYIGDPFWSLPLFYHGPDDVTVWIADKGSCLTALTAGETVDLARGRCGDSRWERNFVPASELRGLSAARPGDLEIVRNALGDEWWEANGPWAEGLVFRMQDDDVIVVEDLSTCT